MEHTSKLGVGLDRDIFYYQQRAKNRVFEAITSFFAQEAEERGITKRDIADFLKRDPAQITRWLTSPSNYTIETLSDLLLRLGAEMDNVLVKFSDRAQANEMHPLIVRVTTAKAVWQQPRDEPTREKKFDPVRPTVMKSNDRRVNLEFEEAA